MKTLVTGGTGFIGSGLTDTLIENGLETIVIDNLSTGNKENLNDQARFYQLDIKDKNIKEVFDLESPDYVFHLAAQINVRSSIEDPLEDARTNILGTLNILDAVVNSKAKKFIFSSTGGAIYGDGVKIPTPETETEQPSSPYGIAKLSIEKYLHFFKQVNELDFVSLRYSNVYGPRQNSKGEAGVVSIFIDNLLAGNTPIINGTGEQTRDYVYVKDVAQANILALELNGIYNLGTGLETNVNEIFLNIVSAMQLDAEEKHGQGIRGEQMRSCLDVSKLREKGWKPEYGLEKGLEETISFFTEKAKYLCNHKVVTDSKV